MNMNKPRNNTRIESQIQSLLAATCPQVRISPTKGDPKPATNNGKFIDRRILVSTTDKLTIGGISSALKNSALNGPTGDFFIRKIDCYSAFTTAGSRISFNVQVGNLLTAGRAAGGSDQIFAEDFGTSARLAGISVTVPVAGSLLQHFDTASTTDVINSINSNDGNAMRAYVTVRQQL